ncbi:MAG: hypothetical protein RLZZ63_272 [Gemmatimonadota bacterium]|jgi:hypothetical protein
MERDQMVCRACGRTERASEGFPCEGCGTFICQLCNLAGVTWCARCTEEPRSGASAGVPRAPRPSNTP